MGVEGRDCEVSLPAVNEGNVDADDDADEDVDVEVEVVWGVEVGVGVVTVLGIDGVLFLACCVLFEC